MNKVSSNLYALINLCSCNMKGLTKAKDIEVFLPIETEKIKIQKIDKKIIVSNNDSILGIVYMQAGCYSNLELLRLITGVYGINPESDTILELMKYKYKIDNLFIKEIKI